MYKHMSQANGTFHGPMTISVTYPYPHDRRNWYPYPQKIADICNYLSTDRYLFTSALAHTSDGHQLKCIRFVIYQQQGARNATLSTGIGVAEDKHRLLLLLFLLSVNRIKQDLPSLWLYSWRNYRQEWHSSDKYYSHLLGSKTRLSKKDLLSFDQLDLSIHLRKWLTSVTTFYT